GVGFKFFRLRGSFQFLPSFPPGKNHWHNKGGKAIKRPILFGILATVIVLIGLLAAGPQRITLAEENTGDEELAQKLRDNAGKAQNRLLPSLFAVDPQHSPASARTSIQK